MATAVYEERRGAGNVALVGALDVLGDPRGIDAAAELVPEAVDVEVELLGIADEVLRRQSVLVLEEEVVHLPVLSLRGRRLRGLRRELGARVDVRERQVAEDEAQLVTKVGDEVAQDRLGAPAEGTLEISVFDERHRRAFRPADVVTLGIDGRRQVHDLLGPSEREACAQLLR